jgi:cation transport ATPase
MRSEVHYNVDYVQTIENKIKFELQPRTVREFTLILETKHGQSQTRTVTKTDSHKYGQSQTRTVTNTDSHKHGQSQTRKVTNTTRRQRPYSLPDRAAIKFCWCLNIVTFIHLDIAPTISRWIQKFLFILLQTYAPGSRTIRFKLRLSHKRHNMSLSFHPDDGNG